MNAPAEPRLAKNHRLVLEVVSEQGHGAHLAMTEIHALARKRRPGIGFTTVYRALVRLRDAGLVSEIILPGADAAYYEPLAPAHAHFRCDRCGVIQDIAYAMPAAVTGDLADRHGITIESAQISLRGTCATCK